MLFLGKKDEEEREYVSGSYASEISLVIHSALHLRARFREPTFHTSNMSTMPGKKKSCFQITSVIQAQVAGNSIIDNAESNDDPDDSCIEDVSSETRDVSRTDLGVCDRSSSEEALDHTGDGHNEPVPVNGLLSVKAIDTGGRNTPLISGGNVPVPAAATTQPIVPTPTSLPSSVTSSAAPTSCSSRFRVIKLDHGTGEPFRRGRWACTEFYEKDSDSNRTVDSMKPTVTHDHSVDRDSGIGVASNSTTAPRAFPAQSVECTDSGSPKGHHSSESLQQAYTLAPQIGSVASAFQPTGYATAKTQQAHDNVQHVISQNFVPNSLNVVHHKAMLQKSPVMPSATQPQQLAYSNGISPCQPDYHPQLLGSSTQSFPATSMVPPSSQPPVSTAAGPGGQGLHSETIGIRAVTPVGQTLGRMGITASSPVTITSLSGLQGVRVTVHSISAAPGRSSVPGGHTQDIWPKSDVLPLSITSAVPGKASVRPLITEGLGLPTPAVSLFGIPITVDGDDDSASGASVVAIDNKIEQAMDLVKNHLMYAVREEVEVLKVQIKELYERNSVLERENAVLKSLANTEQLNKLSSQLNHVNNVALPQLQQQQSMSTNNRNGLGHYEVVRSTSHQPNITTA